VTIEAKPGPSFVAFDVETANSHRGSICAMGLTAVHDGIIVDTHSWLCQPPTGLQYFDPFNIRIHGISPKDVADQPPFTTRLEQMLTVVGDLPVIAHNAAFDLGAIRQGCDQEHLPWPTLTYGCTLMWSRRMLTLLSYRLPLVAEALDIEFTNHHDASADATAAAQILIALMDRNGSSDVATFGAALGIPLGRIEADAWNGCRVTHTSHGTSSHGMSPYGTNLVLPEANPNADPAHPLYGQVIVFTGALSIPRQVAWDAVAALGARAEKAVTKRTTRLVIGDGFTGTTPADFTTHKALRAAALLANGQAIEVLSEEDFRNCLADTHTSGARRRLP
jgi:DNA polymerase-3 subunit epsilon